MPNTPIRKTHLDSLAISLLLLCCAFWGFQQILIKATVGEVPPLWQATLRFWGDGAVVAVVPMARGAAVLS